MALLEYMRLESNEEIYVLRSPESSRITQGCRFHWSALCLEPRKALFTFKTSAGKIIRAYANEIFKEYHISHNLFSVDVFDPDQERCRPYRPQAFAIPRN